MTWICFSGFSTFIWVLPIYPRTCYVVASKRLRVTHVARGCGPARGWRSGRGSFSFGSSFVYLVLIYALGIFMSIPLDKIPARYILASMAKVKMTVWGWKCERCDHEWIPREETEPKV